MTTEFDFINKIRHQFDLTKIGDDCAVLPKNKTHDLLITADLLVEDIDFRRSWMLPENLGIKSLAVSLSDIAAMGGKPLYSMTSIGIPKDIWNTNFIDKFYTNYHKLAKKFGVELIGGDVSKTLDKIVIDSIVLGEVKRGKAVLRSGAKAGDLIFVTGELGGASAGLKLLEEGINQETAKSWQKSLISKQVSPYSKVSTGQDLIKIATSMIDISDGLSSDLMHICQSSQVGAKIYAEKIPINTNIFGLTKNFDEQIEFALNGGEDFELLFTVNPKKNSKKFLSHFSCIGEITQDIENIELNYQEKKSLLQPKGYQHF